MSLRDEIELLNEIKDFCMLICNSISETQIKGEIESKAYYLGHHPLILNPSLLPDYGKQPSGLEVVQCVCKSDTIVCPYCDGTLPKVRDLTNDEAIEWANELLTLVGPAFAWKGGRIRKKEGE